MSHIWSVDDFLSQYSSNNTRNIYYRAYKEYFKLIYPELKDLKDEKLRIQIGKRSVEYFESDRDYRKDLLAYRATISDKALKTIAIRIAVILSFLQDNGIEFN